MRSLIFGCGYLGRRVAASWVNTGHTVFAVTRSEQNANSFLQSGIQPIVGDICEPSTLCELPAVDVVLFAVGFDRNSTRTKQEVVYDGLNNVLAGIDGRCCQLIYTSSTSVYGQSQGEWVDESSDCTPNQSAGQLMLSAEDLVLNRQWTKADTKSTILRLAGIYGPDRMLTRIDSLRAGVAIAGRGDSWLNLIHVDDAAAVVLKCAERDSSASVPRSEVYNIVDDRPIERREFYTQLAKLVDAPPPAFDDTRPSERGSGGLNKRCSNQRYRIERDWTPIYSSIDTGLPAALGILASNSPRSSE